MKEVQRVENPKSPYYGKPYDELPPLPPPPAQVVRNRESRYYGMTLKKAQRLHRKLYPYSPPSEPEPKSFKTVKRRLSPAEKEKLSDPFYVMKANIRELVRWCVKKGLLRPRSKHSKPAAPGKHRATDGKLIHTHGSILLNPFGEIEGVAGYGYDYTLSQDGWEHLLLHRLGEWTCIIQRLELDYTAGKLELKDAMLRAFQIGMDCRLLCVLPHDLDIAAAPPIIKGRLRGSKRAGEIYDDRQKRLNAFFLPLVEQAHDAGARDHIRACQQAARWYNDRRNDKEWLKDARHAEIVKLVNIGRRKKDSPLSAYTVRNWVPGVRQKRTISPYTKT